MKVTKQETLYHEDHGATLKHKCGKRIVTLSLLSFSLIFYLFGLSPFLYGLSLFFIIPHLGQCSRKWWSSHFYLFTTQWLQLDTRTKMTLYECLRRCTGICNEPRVTCMKELWTVALPQILCQLHDHARQYDNDETCHDKRNGGKLHGNISRNGYGNAIIGRYGGCFEEDIRRFMCDRAYHITGFGCTGEVCTNSQGEKGQCTVPKRLAMMERWECV